MAQSSCGPVLGSAASPMARARQMQSKRGAPKDTPTYQSKAAAFSTTRMAKDVSSDPATTR